MAKRIIRTGDNADPIGDSLKNAFVKVNDNFTELYNALGLSDNAIPNLGAFEFTGSVISTTDSSSIVIDQAVNITSDLSVGGDILPQTANGGDLGSSTLPWRSLYVSQSTIYLGGVPLTLDANNNLTVNGSPVTGGGVSSLVNGANTVSLGADGKLTFPNGMVIDPTTYNNQTTFWSGGDAITNGISLTTGEITNSVIIPGTVFADATGVGNTNPLSISGKNGVGITTGADGLAHPQYNWNFGTDGDLTLPEGGDILNSSGQSVLGGGSYTPDDSDLWNSPTVNTVGAALDELAAKVAALENFEIDGGNAYTPAAGELIIDGNGA
jgi:hypothetical protein